MRRRLGAVLLSLGVVFAGCGGDHAGDRVGDGDADADADSDAGADGEPGTPEPCPECVVLANARVFDGSATHPATLILRGDRIDRVLWDRPAPQIGATVVDLTGATILPGLIDLHTHSFVSPGPRGWAPTSDLSGLQVAATLRAGVTTALDAGSPWGRIFELRERIAVDQLPGPRLFVVGPMITTSGGHPCLGGGDDSCVEVGSAAEAPAVLADVVVDGPDALKIIQEQGWTAELALFGADTLAAIVGEAAGRPVLAHVSRSADADAVLDAGVRVLAHAPFQDALSAEVVARLASLDGTVIPTLSVADAAYRLSHGEFDDAADPALRDDVHGSVVDALGDPDLLAPMQTAERRQRSEWAVANATATVQALYAAGVRIATGTDAGNPGVFHGLSIRREIRLYVEAGMSPADAIRAATRNAADVLGRADLGRVEDGAVADLLIVDGDPLTDIEALAAVRSVYVDGRAVDRDALRIAH